MKKQQQPHAYAVDTAAGEPAVAALEKVLAAAIWWPQVAARYRDLFGRFLAAPFGAAIEMVPELARERHSEIVILGGVIAVEVRRSPAHYDEGYLLIARCGSAACVGVVPGWEEADEDLLRELAEAGVTEVIPVSRREDPPIGLAIYQSIG